MQGCYEDVVQEASELFVTAIREREPDLLKQIRTLDVLVRQLLWKVGRLVMETLLRLMIQQVAAEMRSKGLRTLRRVWIRYWTLFGPTRLESPALYDRKRGRYGRPATELGIREGGRSVSLERALTDFGAEESFGRAAARFEEHYGFPLSRTTVMRVTERVAVEAEAYVQERLEERSSFGESSSGHAKGILVELDGSTVRTGELVADPEGGRTPVRGLSRRRREEQWREVRVGLARRLEEVEPTYVARMADYPDVVSQLFGAAVRHGLGPSSETIAVADGGNGLKEALEAQFPNLTFILDRFHLLKHLHETAEAIGLEEEAQREWVDARIERIDAGQVSSVIRQLRSYRGQGEDRTRRLAHYLHRFRDCVEYEAYRERGLPIGSGEVESAHRWLPQKRMKLPGACWKPETVNPMLALRVLRANGGWHDFWQRKAVA